MGKLNEPVPDESATDDDRHACILVRMASDGQKKHARSSRSAIRDEAIVSPPDESKRGGRLTGDFIDALVISPKPALCPLQNRLFGSHQ